MINNVLIALPVLLVGGTEIQTLSVVRALFAGGYKVTVCCYYEFEESVVEEYRCAGAEVILLGLDRSDDSHSIVVRITKLVYRLWAVFRETRPDIVHIQYLAPGLIPILVARFSGIRTIFATVHIAGNYAYRAKAKFFLRLGARLCTAFFCVSRGVEIFWFGNSEVLDAISVNSGRSHFTIYNAVDVSVIEKIALTSDASSIRNNLSLSRGPVIGIVGRLAEQKGHAVLLHAIAEVLKTVPEATLLIIGDGPERESLEETSRSLGLVDNLVWLGSKSQVEVFQLYGIMDVFVMPSLYEGFGLTAAEAMAAGVPVVASNVEGLREVIENQHTGYLCQPGDSLDLASRLKELLADPDLAKTMGGLGKERARALFSLEKFNESMRLAYNKLGKN